MTRLGSIGISFFLLRDWSGEGTHTRRHSDISSDSHALRFSWNLSILSVKCWLLDAQHDEDVVPEVDNSN
jgi:hypothetical protein